MRQWRERFLPSGWRPDHRVVPESLRRIQGKVIDLGVHRALELGQFPDGEPDYATPQWSNMLIGDGTWVKKYSRAEIIDDPELGPVRRGSRAHPNGRPRREQAAQTVDKDDKKSSSHRTGHGTCARVRWR